MSPPRIIFSATPDDDGNFRPFIVAEAVPVRMPVLVRGKGKQHSYVMTGYTAIKVSRPATPEELWQWRTGAG